MRQLTAEQLARARQARQRWEQTPAPCGIAHTDPYNPCLPEEDGGSLLCLTCGLRQEE